MGLPAAFRTARCYVAGAYQAIMTIPSSTPPGRRRQVKPWFGPGRGNVPPWLLLTTQAGQANAGRGELRTAQTGPLQLCRAAGAGCLRRGQPPCPARQPAAAPRGGSRRLRLGVATARDRGGSVQGAAAKASALQTDWLMCGWLPYRPHRRSQQAGRQEQQLWQLGQQPAPAGMLPAGHGNGNRRTG